MYLSSPKVPQSNCLLNTIVLFLTSTLLIGHIVCSDSSNINSENYANNKKVPTPSSTATMEKQQRSSYAVISQAMSSAVENEFGSK